MMFTGHFRHWEEKLGPITDLPNCIDGNKTKTVAGPFWVLWFITVSYAGNSVFCMYCIVLTIYVLQGVCTWCPMNEFSGFTRKMMREYSKEDVDTLFEVEWAPGKKWVSAEFVAYSEWIMWRSCVTTGYVKCEVDCDL